MTHTTTFTSERRIESFSLNAWRKARQIIVTRSAGFGLIVTNLTEVTHSSDTTTPHVGFIVGHEGEVKPASWRNDGTNARNHIEADIVGILEFNFDWSDINPEYSYLAMDAKGAFYFYDAEPKLNIESGQWLSRGSDYVRASAIHPARLPKVNPALWSGVLISREED